MAWHQTQPAGGPTGQPVFLERPLPWIGTVASFATGDDAANRASSGELVTNAGMPGTIDLDLLLFGDEIIESDALVVLILAC
ncbi:MAG: hypothetical protein R3C28_01750 [Pirellulaceae bacterium]